MAVDNELVETWKKAIVAYFKELFHHLPGKTTKNVIQGNPCSSQDSNWTVSEHKSEALSFCGLVFLSRYYYI
jgi:hypothetical protein